MGNISTFFRECALLHETNLGLASLRPKASFNDNYESSIPLEYTFVGDAPLTDLEAMSNPPLTFLTFVAPSCSSTL